MGKIDFVPSNELAVREWFAANLDKFDYDIVVSKSSFPDYTLRDSTGKKYKVEVELKSGNFLAHKHDPKKCDFILCWIHNQKVPLPVLELSTEKMHEARAEPTSPDEYGPVLENMESETLSTFFKAAKSCRGEINAFVLAVADDLRVQSQYTHLIQDSRLKLMSSSRYLIGALELHGFKYNDSGPYGLFDLILKLPQEQR